MCAGGVQGPTAGLSQQVGVAEGSPWLEVQQRAGSSPDNDGTGRHHQTARVRQARRRGVTRVNQWLNPLKRGTGSNLVDMGRAAAGADRLTGMREPEATGNVVSGVTGNVCGVPVTRLQGKSWAPIPPTGTW